MIRTSHSTFSHIFLKRERLECIRGRCGWLVYFSTIVSETAVAALTLLRRQYLTAVLVWGNALPRLLRTMYRDGTVFYIILLCVSVANLLCMRFAPVWVSPALQLYVHNGAAAIRPSSSRSVLECCSICARRRLDCWALVWTTSTGAAILFSKAPSRAMTITSSGIAQRWREWTGSRAVSRFPHVLTH
ncbi:hypothetical protein C8Q77DRAFT_1106057 [Trametes polyzona]|nr:hypothetical protein C8Q77DRAFT_1106057 [Trametes polyzona]